MNKKIPSKLLRSFIKTNGNASQAGRNVQISAGHARKLLSGITVKQASKLLNSKNETQEILFPISDIHCGEVIVPTPLNGQNKYNSKVAKQRVELLFTELKSMINAWDQKIHIVNLGDAISGMLHDENAPTDEMTSIVAINYIAKILIAEIKKVREEFPEIPIEVWGVTSNHDRSTRKIWAKHSIETSYDYQLGQTLEIAFADADKITIHPVFDDQLINVGGVNWAISHGHWGNGPTIPGAIKGQAFQRLQSMQLQWEANGYQVDAALIGHFHTLAMLQDWFVCPAVCGPNEFETKKLRLRPNKPKSWIFRCVDSEIVDREIIELT